MILEREHMWLREESGATLVEFALVGGLFLIIILTAIDVSRLFFVQTLLTKGAQEGVALATKIANLEIDTEKLEAGETDQFELYAEAREAVINAATSDILAIAAERADVNPNAAVKLLVYTPSDLLNSAEYTNATYTIPEPAAVLRPGDGGIDGKGNSIFHPVRCSAVLGDCLSPRKAWETMETLLDSFPVFVQLDAEVHTYSPWLSTIRLRGEAMGWREKVIKSGFSSGISEQLLKEILNRPHTPPKDIVCDDSDTYCPDGYTWYDPACKCTCDEPDAGCPFGSYWDNWSCECLADAGG